MNANLRNTMVNIYNAFVDSNYIDVKTHPRAKMFLQLYIKTAEPLVITVSTIIKSYNIIISSVYYIIISRLTKNICIIYYIYMYIWRTLEHIRHARGSIRSALADCNRDALNLLCPLAFTPQYVSVAPAGSIREYCNVTCR